MKIILKRDTLKNNPLGFGHNYRVNDVVGIERIDYPGLMIDGKSCDEWVFWTSRDIDEAYIFKAEDVESLMWQTAPVGIEAPFKIVRKAPPAPL